MMSRNLYFPLVLTGHGGKGETRTERKDGMDAYLGERLHEYSKGGGCHSLCPVAAKQSRMGPHASA